MQHSQDPRLAELALEIVKRLEAERDILITKAISWLLRSLVAQHRGSVVRHLAAHETTLPSVAVRETRAKLRTGRKTRVSARAAQPRR